LFKVSFKVSLSANIVDKVNFQLVNLKNGTSLEQTVFINQFICCCCL